MKKQEAPRVVIGTDPHERSITIEVMTPDELVVGGRTSGDGDGPCLTDPAIAFGP